ncbi:phage tail protein [Dyella flagellata]|uniref:Phage tail protein n=1 Tax=Dyella flagellata TaxID=1867833 RepID=A0ABQ5X8A3_9GAMM|nr:phage tail protein [Dyella flagellata]GLQ87815.1 phage tail protein [Dyella flagellata]
MAPGNKKFVDPYAPELPAAFCFSVQLGDSSSGSDSSFQEVSGIELSMEVDEVREGGENRFVHQLPTGVKQKRLTLKRGIASSKSGLVGWCRRTLEGDLSESIKLVSLTVKLLDEEAIPLRSWSFTNAYPVRWEIDTFNSTKNEVALETIELAYQTVTRQDT